MAFRQDGREVVRVQMILEASAEQCEHWAVRWAALQGAPQWIVGRFVYHEEVGVVEGPRTRLWNPTEGVWREPAPRGTGVLARRFQGGEWQSAATSVEGS